MRYFNNFFITGATCTLLATFFIAPVATLANFGYGGGGNRAIPAIPAVPTVPPAMPTIPPQGRVLGAATLNFLNNLGIGSRGADVTALQQFLIDDGYSIPAGATGYFGAQTRAAVIAFQKARGIAQVGVVGPLTRAELNRGTLGATPETTSGSKLSAVQANAIVGLLRSFDAEAEIIANVKVALGL